TEVTSPQGVINGKTPFKPHRLHPPQFNEFYRKCSRHPSCAPQRSPVSTPDRMLFIIGSLIASHLHLDEMRVLRQGDSASWRKLCLLIPYNPSQILFARVSLEEQG